MPTINLPKLDFPRAGVPKVNAPRVNVPKIGAPKVNVPKVNLPKVNVPKVGRHGISGRVEEARGKAVELGVYLPLGTYAAVKDGLGDIHAPRIGKLYSDLVKRGQTTAAPVERAVGRRRRQARATANEVETTTARATQSASRSVKKTTRKATGRARSAAPETPRPPRVATPSSASELPIARYDELTAEEIVSQTKGLTQTDLAKVYKYEKANENRATVISAIESRFTSLPIPTYDALTVDEISERLPNLKADELKKVRDYEKSTKNRATVIERIEALLAGK